MRLSIALLASLATLFTARTSPATPAVAVETACNGIDDDGDGLVDVLLPVGANGCSVPGRGACRAGYAACERGQRVCLAPPPTPEVRDGVDNDCNGVVDDVAPVAAAVHGRALVLQPLYAQREAAPDLANVASALAQAGISFDRPTGEAGWTQGLDALASGDRYALAVVPGYLMGSAVSGEAGEKLRRFVEHGGVLVLWKPIGAAATTSAWELAGLRRSARHRDVESLRFEDVLPGAFAAIDSPEERTVPINRPVNATNAANATSATARAADRVEVYALDPDPLAGTQVVARGQAGALAFPVITRRPLGKGAVYALGHDLSTFAAPRCYLDCFEPAGDLLRLFLLGALKEGAHGHVAVLATAPEGATSALLLLHAVDPAEHPDPQSDAEILELARMESRHHARSTFAVSTAGTPLPLALCALGMCPLAAHGVTHSLRFVSLPRGALEGEIAGAAAQIEAQTGRRPRLWTSPYLAPNPQLFPVLARQGFLFDAGFAVGDLPYNLPLDTDTIGAHQERFQHAALIEFPVAGEDALETGPRRIDLDPSNARRFTAMWDYLTLRNADNESASTLLSHVRIGGGGQRQPAGEDPGARGDARGRGPCALRAGPRAAAGDDGRLLAGAPVGLARDDLRRRPRIHR